MTRQPILLTLLLRERRWHTYTAFCAEYAKAAQRIDPALAHGYPSRAQLHRWLSGSLRSLPYGDHCRVLEAMFPGCTAEQLFQPPGPEHAQLHHNGSPAQHGTSGPPMTAIPSVGIRPYIEHAFAREHVRIDFAGFSGETLHGVLQEPLDKIRIGQLKPASVTIRLLMPDTSRPMTLPCRADDLADDPDFRARAARLASRHAHAILDSVQELTDLGLVPQADAALRVHACSPLFKLYLINGEEAFFGFYPIVKHTIPLPSGRHDIYDLMGKDALVFHHSTRNGQPTQAAYIEQAQTWFNTMWDTISYETPA